MAVWGAPAAHEDDAERAVRAGLELVDAVRGLGSGLQARAGVLTGEAAVTIGAQGQGLVAGDLVNTASRLQSVAAPGTVLVGEATQRSVARVIEFEEAGEQALKGKAAPVPAWRAVRVVAERGGRRRSDGLEAPFVGRDDELRLLKDLFHATERERKTRLVSVSGPGGIGKSRLAWEFLKYVDGLADIVFWHDGRSPAYGDGISFWALGEMVRARCGLVETDDEPTTRAKVAEAVATHVPDPEERRWIEAALLVLLGVGGGVGSEQLFAAWRTFFERLAATAPVVMVFEDFHFADSGLLAFLDHLLEWTRHAPICVVTLARPELLEKHPGWGAGARNFTSIRLDPLPEPAMRQLLAGLVPGLPEAAIGAIVGRADGVPMYAVETVRMLIADGRLVLADGVYRPSGDLTSVAIPETLTAVIASRLDGLPTAERALISDAAVLGQSFTPAALSAVSGAPEADLEPRLRGLVRHELLAVEADPRSPERGQYAFVQALIREVAYNTLAKRERKVRHLAAARYFESLGSEELAGGLAGHYLAAYQNAGDGPDADALAVQARIALRAAAERATSLGSFGQAVVFFDQALGVARDDPERADLLQRASDAAATASINDVAEDRLRRAVDLRRQLGEPDALADALARMGSLLINVLRRDAARVLLEAGAVETLGPDDAAMGPGGVALLAQLSRAYFFREEYRRSIEVADRALEAGERLDLAPVVADTLITRGSALANLGRSYEGLGTIRAGIALADELGLVSTGLRGRLNLGVLSKDARVSFEAAQEGLEIARRYGLRGFVRTLLGNKSSAAIPVGEWEVAWRDLDAAFEESTDDLERNYLAWALVTFNAWRGADVSDEVERLVAWAESFGEQGARDATLGLRAEVAFGDGDPARASELWLEYAPTDALNASQSYALAGVAGLLARDRDRARRALDGLRGLPGHSPVRANQERLLAAGIAGLDGRTAEALREGTAALAEYERMDLPWPHATGTMALVAAIGPEPELLANAATARATIVRLGASPFLVQLDALLASGPAAAASTTSVRSPDSPHFVRTT
jgi:tetratricopeptide (TPR) repeat protein